MKFSLKISILFLLVVVWFSFSYSEEVFTQVPIWGGQVDGAVLCYSSPSVIYAWNSLNLWVSEDAAETWRKTKLFDYCGRGPACVAVHPSSPNIVLAWVEAYERYDQQRGLYRSEDYGETWEKIQDITYFRPAWILDLPKEAGFPKIETLYFSLKDFDTVYLFGQTYWDPVTGLKNIVLYKSTDAGKTWQKKILLANDPNNYNEALSFCVTCDDKSDILYMGVSYNPTEYTREFKLFKSTDGGETLKDISFTMKIDNYEFVVRPTRIEASTTGCVAIGLYVSTNSGESFKLIKFSDTEGVTDLGYFPTFAFSPCGTKLYCSAVGYDPIVGTRISKIFMSTFTEGVGWSDAVRISSGILWGKAGLEARDILVDPINPDNMYIADNFDYGFFKSTDGGYIWEAKNYGLAGAYVNSGVKDSQGNLYIVTKSAIYKSTDSGNSWSKLYSSFYPLEGCKIAVHPINNDLVFLLCWELYISEDGGVSWKDSKGNAVDSFRYTSFFPGKTDVIFDLRDTNILYYGKDCSIMRYDITKTTEQVIIWFQSLPGSPMSVFPYVFSLASDPKDPSILYAGVGRLDSEVPARSILNVVLGELWKIKIDEDGNVLSSERTGLSDVIPFKIIFDTTNPNVIYVAAYDKPIIVGPNFRYVEAYGGLYKSEDDGLSWKKVGVIGNVESSVGLDAVIDFQVVKGIVYVANKDETGFTNLYYSLNGGLTFDKYEANIGEIKCLILGSLYAGSTNGLWRLNRQPQPLSYEVENPKVYVFPNPFNPKNGYTVLKYFVPQGKTVDDLRVSIYNIAGELIYEFKEPTGLAGGYAYYYAWDGKNQNGNLCSKGVYIAVFRSNLGVAKTKIVLVK